MGEKFMHLFYVLPHDRKIPYGNDRFQSVFI